MVCRKISEGQQLPAGPVAGKGESDVAALVLGASQTRVKVGRVRRLEQVRSRIEYPDGV